MKNSTLFNTIVELRASGITLKDIQNELDYREQANVLDGIGGWNDDLIYYPTEELQDMELAWEEN